jgi:hypothetical protein
MSFGEVGCEVTTKAVQRLQISVQRRNSPSRPDFNGWNTGRELQQRLQAALDALRAQISERRMEPACVVDLLDEAGKASMTSSKVSKAIGVDRLHRGAFLRAPFRKTPVPEPACRPIVRALRSGLRIPGSGRRPAHHRRTRLAHICAPRCGSGCARHRDASQGRAASRRR